VHAALRAQGKKDINVVGWAGDGGTSDIGIQALSGAIERGEDFIYICYDNEGYMNTGVQRSGTTPIGAITTNTPLLGKLQPKKDMLAIMAAHGIAYVAATSAAYPLDLYDKIRKAQTFPGTKYIHIFTPCPSGWGFPTKDAVRIGRLAVETGLFDLFEIENGNFKLTGASNKMLRSKKMLPVKEYFKSQIRFRKMSNETIARMQQNINERWHEYRASV
jgi:pyruvate ferredoxin oxidoreductase beta subunit